MIKISLRDFKRVFGEEKTKELIDNGHNHLLLNKEYKDNQKCWFLYTSEKRKLKQIKSHVKLSKLLGVEDFETEYDIINRGEYEK